MRASFLVLAAVFVCSCRAHAPASGSPPGAHPETFYRELIENECSATKNAEEMNCCIESVRRMERLGYEPLPPEADRCPKGQRVWSKGCAGSLRWCASAR
ncbi:MAG: hypothetical protein AUJ52_01120 [Elusimicrobia bacterium CG1_02_63_36]|nr:MAG: hypothetical protein AUJ52_01120 [Elusimicrobia bacterium CG1_02_63_36]PIP84184.1 MAG: hypothetical protein COR54_05115 [Elusimicrobia bacterium CG22_combo_CG10-13_8_21_14_all_63_91]PJA17746.1 MAG: hypothetical protein COX66_03540 [Elusimicrobia bacterium CG_4_10_14_0_2_um_filter_63_34]PJB26661.1 MAG: hypothetical protein CO113_02550 [Elusimicrobia bacterium CG_4_9_14_3_um_filter_62_55]